MYRATGLLVFLVLFWGTTGFTADGSEKRTGWIAGGVPALGYNSDSGFNYGVVVELYNFSDGSTYPNFKHGIHAEWSKTTRGSSIADLFLEAPNIFGRDLRVTIHITRRTELLQPYYGINGYGAAYNSAYENEDAEEYISRLYYTTDRKLWQSTMDFQGVVLGNWDWLGGFGWFDIRVGSTRVKKIDDELPNETLYSKQRESGDIPAAQANGGLAGFVKMGAVYDSRNRERTPTKGVWSEGLLTRFTSQLGSEFDYTMLTLTHRQYFPIIGEKLILAGRAILQQNIAGETPMYMMPFIMSSRKTIEGLGGAQTIRGVLQNRVVGESVVFANIETRWKVHRISLFNQEFYATLNGFYDTGRVISTSADAFHHGVGIGVSVVMNRTIIGSIDVAKPLDSRDGTFGIYMHSGYLF